MCGHVGLGGSGKGLVSRWLEVLDSKGRYRKCFWEGNAVKALTGNVFSLLSGSRSSKTFKPKKNIPEGSHQYELLKHAEATLGSGNLRQAVMLPEGEDLNEWIAVNSKCYKRGMH